MKNTKLFNSILLLLVFSISSIGFLMIASASNELPEYIAVDINSGLAGKQHMPKITDDSNFAEVGGSGAGILATPPVGTTVYDWYVNAISGSPDLTLRAEAEYVEVWVQNDLSFPEGDSRNDDPWKWMVTDEMAQYLADEFSSWIYSKCADYFGAPLDRNGSNTLFEAIGWPSFTWDWIETDNPQKVILKVINYRDENYYNPTYPYYVAGFFSSTYTGYYDRNMIHIDSWQWYRRLGPEGTSWLPDHPEEVVPEERAYSYEAITAHEFQHNIHRDYIPEAESWMNEGLSMYSEILCEYGIPWTDINSYLATPDNSLTEWEDQTGINVLADYGQVALWATYLVDQFGSNILADYIAGGVDGIEGLNAVLPKHRQFEEVYHDFRIANLIHSNHPGHGRYNYKTIDLSEADPIHVQEIHGTPVPFESAVEKFGTTETILGYDTGMSKIGPYGSDYIQFSDFPRRKWKDRFILFDGDDDASLLNHWTFSDPTWYSGEGNLFDDLIYGEAYVDPADPTLALTTYWDIEDFWDFGFVQVSTDDGSTWTSLENEYTTYDYDPDAIQTAIDNLPGLTSWSGFIEEAVDGWVSMTFDLTAYAGQTILIGFRYVTDWNTFYEGWYVDDVTVSGAAVTLEPYIVSGLPIEGFMISIVLEFNTRRGNHYIVWDMKVDPETQMMLVCLPIKGDRKATMIVSPIMDTGFIDYSFGSLRQWKK
jgi:hypothetical protein